MRSSILRAAALTFLSLLAAACSAGGTGDAPPAARPAQAPVESAAPTAVSPVPTSPAKEMPAMSPAPEKPAADAAAKPRTEVATLAGGCFWCMEAVLETVPGVTDVRSGYIGGKTAKPTYQEVCDGDTGHAEAIQVTFDPSKVSYEQILEWFWKAHDPTTLDRQGPDVGTQYRSAIFTHSDAQRAAAEKSKAEAQKRFEDPIVTEISPAGPFTEAEGYHQDYYRLNRTQGYCRAIIAPKLKKLGIEK